MIELLCKQNCTEQKPKIQHCSSPSGKPRWVLQYWSSSNANKKWMLQHLTATACCLPTSLRSDSAWPYTNKTNKQTKHGIQLSLKLLTKLIQEQRLFMSPKTPVYETLVYGNCPPHRSQFLHYILCHCRCLRIIYLIYSIGFEQHINYRYKSISSNAQRMTRQKYFSHPRSVIYFFPTPPTKLKLGLQIGGRLLIPNHLDQSL